MKTKQLFRICAVLSPIVIASTFSVQALSAQTVHQISLEHNRAQASEMLQTTSTEKMKATAEEELAQTSNKVESVDEVDASLSVPEEIQASRSIAEETAPEEIQSTTENTSELIDQDSATQEIEQSADNDQADSLESTVEPNQSQTPVGEVSAAEPRVLPPDRAHMPPPPNGEYSIQHGENFEGQFQPKGPVTAEQDPASREEPQTVTTKYNVSLGDVNQEITIPGENFADKLMQESDALIAQIDALIGPEEKVEDFETIDFDKLLKNVDKLVIQYEGLPLTAETQEKIDALKNAKKQARDIAVKNNIELFLDNKLEPEIKLPGDSFIDVLFAKSEKLIAEIDSVLGIEKEDEFEVIDFDKLFDMGDDIVIQYEGLPLKDKTDEVEESEEKVKEKIAELQKAKDAKKEEDPELVELRKKHEELQKELKENKEITKLKRDLKIANARASKFEKAYCSAQSSSGNNMMDLIQAQMAQTAQLTNLIQTIMMPQLLNNLNNSSSMQVNNGMDGNFAQGYFAALKQQGLGQNNLSLADQYQKQSLPGTTNNYYLMGNPFTNYGVASGNSQQVDISQLFNSTQTLPSQDRFAQLNGQNPLGANSLTGTSSPADLLNMNLSDYLFNSSIQQPTRIQYNQLN